MLVGGAACSPAGPEVGRHLGPLDTHLDVASDLRPGDRINIGFTLEVVQSEPVDLQAARLKLPTTVKFHSAHGNRISESGGIEVGAVRGNLQAEFPELKLVGVRDVAVSAEASDWQLVFVLSSDEIGTHTIPWVTVDYLVGGRSFRQRLDFAITLRILDCDSEPDASSRVCAEAPQRDGLPPARSAEP